MSENTSITIEKAVPEDAEAVSDLLRRTWMATYPNEAAGITKEDIRLRTEGADGERIPQNIEKWRNIIATQDGTAAMYIARSNGVVVGMVNPTIIDGRRRVGALYVSPEMQGKGIGSKLMAKMLEWHGDHVDIYLNAASYNRNAINFYKKFGFVQSDTAIEDTGNVYGGKQIPEIEMVRRGKK